MREVYKFAELSETAQTRAIEAIREKLDSDWWDQSDNEDVAACMVYELAGELHYPGHDTYGTITFPGIEGVTLDGWSLGRHQSLAASGRLDRVNAPALPWVDGIEHVELAGHRSDATTVTVVDADPDCTCSPDHYLQPHDEGCPSLVASPATDEQRNALEQAVRDALSAAWTAGERAAEHKTGEQYAREQIEANEYEFTEDGELYA